MKNAYLEKLGRKNVEFCLLEIENGFLQTKLGMNEKVLSSRIRNCGSQTEALEEMQAMVDQYQGNGYKLKKNRFVTEANVFDKAKWHFNNDFPNNLSDFHAYIHTGFFIGWLIKNKLISEDLELESKTGVEAFLKGEITGSHFYKDYLDGVFSSNDVSDVGLKFVENYFNFENGSYLRDYEHTLAANLPTIYNVKDTEEGFKKISDVITRRFEEFISKSL